VVSAGADVELVVNGALTGLKGSAELQSKVNATILLPEGLPLSSPPPPPQALSNATEMTQPHFFKLYNDIAFTSFNVFENLTKQNNSGDRVTFGAR
jgi:hypothetical protein